MFFMGREIDPVELWENYVSFPPNMDVSGPFLPLVKCPNPDHHTEKRHFQINVQEPLVHCFARCGISGTYEKAISICEGVNERAARKLILRYTTLLGTGAKSRKRVRTGDAKDRTIDLEYETHIPSVGIGYLESRGIDGSSIARWELGWDTYEKRIVIPAHDQSDVLRFLIKRAVKNDQWPKYLYSEGFPKTSLLFGACKVGGDAIDLQRLVLVEGSIDTIMFHQFGIGNTCGTLGSGLSRKQVEIIARLRPKRGVYLFFDKDGAGARNVFQAEQVLVKYPLFVCLFPKGKNDPAELTRKEAVRQLDRALPIREFRRRVPETVKKRKETSA